MEEFKYDQSDIHLSYDQARALPVETIKSWLNAISKYVPSQSIKTIVDLGCGTGRFTEALSAQFSAKVIGIDPSLNMLLTAKQFKSSQLVEFVHGVAESIPLAEDKADLIFLSMVYHHIQDKTKAVMEFRRILKRDCFVCVRTSTPELLDSYLWMRFFPSARDIDARRLPSGDALVNTFGSNRFQFSEHTVIQQLFANSLSEYVGKIKLRGISSLREVSDDEYQEGLANLEKYCYENETGRAVLEDIDLFVFQAI